MGVRGARLLFGLSALAYVAPSGATCAGVHKRIHLTFDDGPDPTYTAPILETLKRENVKATFFMLGHNLEQSRLDSVVRAVRDEGHVLASHTYSHINSEKPTYSMADIERNIDRFYEAAQSFNGRQTAKKETPVTFSRYVRMPYGAYFWNQERLQDPRANELRNYLAARKLKHVLWNVDSQDYMLRDRPREVYVAKVLRRIRRAVCDPKSPSDLVVLMHDIQPGTADGLDDVIAALKQDGHTFVTLREVVRTKDFRGKVDIDPQDPTFDPLDFPPGLDQHKGRSL